MKKIKILLVIVIIGLSACTDTLTELNLEEIKDQEISLDNKYDVSIQEAEDYAFSFMKKEKKIFTRSIENLTTSIETLTDKDGNPLIHIINIGNNEGFVILSASKKITPILAYSDKGRFDINETNMGLIWLGKIGEDILVSKKDTTIDFDPKWKNELSKKIEPILTRSSNKTVAEWRTQTFMDLVEDPDNYKPTELEKAYAGENIVVLGVGTLLTLREFMHENNIFNTPQPFEVVNRIMNGCSYDPSLALLMYADFSKHVTYGPLTENWHQNSPYNDSIPDKKLVGCVPVALGEIVYCNKYPADYADWNKIANEKYTSNKPETARMLRQIGRDVGGMTYGHKRSFPQFWQDFSFSDLSHAKKFFKGQNYEIIKENVQGNYLAFRFMTASLEQGYPVYMEGTKELFSIFGIRIPSLDAHAWVCDGVRLSEYTTICRGIYLPSKFGIHSDLQYSTNPYEKLEQIGLFTLLKQSTYYFHMNWGWQSTSSNGWYLSANIGRDKETDYTVFYNFITARPKK